jgi:excisionase family DNA binding protein
MSERFDRLLRGDLTSEEYVESLKLLTADDLATRWGVSKAHVYALTREGKIPAVRIGRYYRYRLESIERWEHEQESP